MPANPSDTPNEAENEAPAEPMSRAERRAAARGKTVQHDDAHPWGQGKVAGARNNQSTRRSFSNRRSGG
jgi:hypothetical protein